MFKNYFIVAFRNIRRNKAFSLINISGLAIGMASAILILLWVGNEMSTDRFHEKIDRLYVMNNRDKFDGKVWAWASTPKVLGPAIKSQFPEAEAFTRVNDVSFLLNAGDKHLNEGGAFVDSAYLSMLSFPLVQGNPATALNNTYNIVITQQLAKKLFNDENVVGKEIRIDSTDNFVVSGVLKDMPNNTMFSYEYLLPWSYMQKLGWSDSSWGNNSVTTLLLLKNGTNRQAFDRKVKNITIDHTSGTAYPSTTQVFTQPLKERWLYSRSENGVYVTGRIEQVRVFTIIAIFILLIACINFMNLSTARSEKRAKEVGIRKVIGARKSSLVLQFIGESIILSLIAGLIGLLLVQLSLKWFNHLTEKNLFIDYLSPINWLYAILFVVITGLLAGSYPALYLSAYKPVTVLKGTFKKAHQVFSPRKVLVVLQFTFAIALIICTIIVRHQLLYAQERDSGYRKDQLVFSFLQGDLEKHYAVVRNELVSSGAAVSVTKSMSPITERYSDSWGFKWAGSHGEDDKIDFIRMSTDADFVKTMGVQLLAGRDIDINQYASDSTAVLLNEAAVKVMRLKDPVGQIIEGDGTRWHVVGVLKDFIYESPYQKISQLMVFGPRSWFNVVHFKLNPALPTAKSLQMVETIFKKYNPNYPFIYRFVDEDYARKFKSEQRTGTLAALFAGLTIFISCLGLFGLAAYMAENRIKEIGVRKVLGASIFSITKLLSQDFLKLVLVAFLIASPLAWFFMNKWLQGYEYRIQIEWWVFLLAGVASALIAVATVSYQSIKAALANPVRSLRTE
jgi:putative ABC transport system permease protein